METYHLEWADEMLWNFQFGPGFELWFGPWFGLGFEPVSA